MLRHSEDCARVVSNLLCRCNCGARAHEKYLRTIENEFGLMRHYILNNDAPAISWLRAHSATIEGNLVAVRANDALAKSIMDRVGG